MDNLATAVCLYLVCSHHLPLLIKLQRGQGEEKVDMSTYTWGGEYTLLATELKLAHFFLLPPQIWLSLKNTKQADF